MSANESNFSEAKAGAGSWEPTRYGRRSGGGGRADKGATGVASGASCMYASLGRWSTRQAEQVETGCKGQETQRGDAEEC